jgi:hypothetical protein
MDKDYFNSLKNSVQDSERSVNNVINSTDQTLLTVKVDIDCKVYCDGDFLDLLEANKTKQFTIETGPHLITIESEKYEELVEDREIDAKGRNNLVVVKDMKQKEQEYLQKQEDNKREIEINAEADKQILRNKEVAEEALNNGVMLKCSIKIQKEEIARIVERFIVGNSSKMYIHSTPDIDAAITDGTGFVSLSNANNIVEKLFSGENVYLFDTNANGEIYGNKKHEIVGNTSNVMYTINISDFVRGLENAACSTYKVYNDSKYVWQCFVSLLDEDSEDFYDEAQTLMQIIVFDEFIYG